MLHRLDDGPLDFIGDLLFAPVLELCAGCELAHKVGAMAAEPLVWVTSGRMQATQFQLDPLGVRGVSLCVLAVKRGIVAEQFPLTLVPPAERCRSCLQLRGPICSRPRGCQREIVALSPDERQPS